MVKFRDFKKIFLYTLIASLILSALVAVITVMIGAFNDVIGKVLWTLGTVIFHSLICLAFIWDDEKKGTFNRLALFIDVIFYILVLSFITSILGIWGILGDFLLMSLYQAYGVIAFAALHGDLLSKSEGKINYLNKIIKSNYIFIVIVLLMLLVSIFIQDATIVLGELFFRILGAMAIIDGTLSVLTIIFYRIYVGKHPEKRTKERKGLSAWVWILIIFFGFNMLSVLGMILISSLLY